MHRKELVGNGIEVVLGDTNIENIVLGSRQAIKIVTAAIAITVTIIAGIGIWSISASITVYQRLEKMA